MVLIKNKLLQSSIENLCLDISEQCYSVNIQLKKNLISKEMGISLFEGVYKYGIKKFIQINEKYGIKGAQLEHHEKINSLLKSIQNTIAKLNTNLKI